MRIKLLLILFLVTSCTAYEISIYEEDISIIEEEPVIKQEELELDFIYSDFFMCKIRGDELIRLRNRGDFLGMESLVQNYIDEMGSDIRNEDTAFRILNHLKPMLAVLSNVEIEYNYTNDVAVIFYSGLTNVSAKSNFVLHTSTRSNSIYAMIGFHHHEWVYAERVRIRLKNGNIIGFSMDTSIKEVISDYEIRERIFVRLTNSDITDLLDSKVDVIRFEFDGNQHIDDIDLSEAEQNAFEVIYQFRDMNYFSDLKRAIEYA